MSRSGRKRTCARVETSLPEHKRLRRIPPGTRRGHALGVWLAALCHSRFHELDGFCPTEALHGFLPDEAIEDLVNVGLFARGEQDGVVGVVVVNYAEFNDTKADIDDRLQRDRVRKDRSLVPRGIRSDSHPSSAVKPVEKSSVEKDLISDSDARATDRSPDSSLPSLPPETPVHVPAPGAPVHVLAPDTSVHHPASDHGTFGMHVDAYGEGIGAVTGVAYVKSGPFEAKMLEDCATRAGGLTGQKLLAWYREKAEKFARSVNPRFGYSAHRFVAWLNGGERTDSQGSAAPPSAGPPSAASTRDLSRPESRNLNNLGAGLPPLPPLRPVAVSRGLTAEDLGVTQ
jgi:hypothetical protein